MVAAISAKAFRQLIAVLSLVTACSKPSPAPGPASEPSAPKTSAPASAPSAATVPGFAISEQEFKKLHEL